MTKKAKEIEIEWVGPIFYSELNSYRTDTDFDFYIFTKIPFIIKTRILKKFGNKVIYIGKTINDPNSRIKTHEKENDIIKRAKIVSRLRAFIDDMIREKPVLNEIKESLIEGFENRYPYLEEMLRKFRKNRISLFFGKATHKGLKIPRKLIIPIENALIAGHYMKFKPEPFENIYNLTYDREEQFVIFNHVYPLEPIIKTSELTLK